MCEIGERGEALNSIGATWLGAIAISGWIGGVILALLACTGLSVISDFRFAPKYPKGFGNEAQPHLITTGEGSLDLVGIALLGTRSSELVWSDGLVGIALLGTRSSEPCGTSLGLRGHRLDGGATGNWEPHVPIGLGSDCRVLNTGLDWVLDGGGL